MNLQGLNKKNGNPSKQIFTVSQLTRSIKTILESEYRFVKISGEISNLKTPYSGHSYFTLKDSSAQIRAVLFKQQKRFVDLALEDGQEVICFGRITVYEPRGDYQLVIDSIEMHGTGQLQREFEQLKEKLNRKGYYDTSKKKQLPFYPKKICVITSPTGAALQDFLKIATIRRNTAHIQILPVKVQGAEAPAMIAKAINKANEIDAFDVIVLCRGGGSLEDLWAFNEEIVAESIYLSKVAVVTGIGHEIDFTIADFCSDFRCPTPTAAAEQLIPDKGALQHHLATLRNSLIRNIQNVLAGVQAQVQYSSKILENFKNVVKDSEYRFNLSKTYLLQAIAEKISTQEDRLRELKRRVYHRSPETDLQLQEKQVLHLKKDLNMHLKRILENKQYSLATQAALLNSVSPLATLGRGYAVVKKYSESGKTYKVVSSIKKVTVGDEVIVLLHEGEIDCVVKNTKNTQ